MKNGKKKTNAAARDTEREWQITELRKMLEGEQCKH